MEYYWLLYPVYEDLIFFGGFYTEQHAIDAGVAKMNDGFEGLYILRIVNGDPAGKKRQFWDNLHGYTKEFFDYWEPFHKDGFSDIL